MNKTTIKDLPLMQQLIYVAYVSENLAMKQDIPKSHVKYAPDLTIVKGPHSCTFKRLDDPSSIEVTFDTQPVNSVNPVNSNIVSVNVNTKLIITGDLRTALIEARYFIHKEILPMEGSEYTNMPAGLIYDIVLGVEKASTTFNDPALVEEWVIDLVTINQLNKLFEAQRLIQREEPGMSWLIENHSLIINNHLTDNVYIEIGNRASATTVAFKPMPLDDDFEFYIQLHKDIRRYYQTNPDFKCTLATWDEWEESLYTAITKVTDKAPYRATIAAAPKMPKPRDKMACIYSNEILTPKD